ncbi:DNA/RNA nuclease SfsA [Myxococcota bacterium]|nr:DNA/RNA nuclease SfsA [Myxococcota bacterium]
MNLGKLQEGLLLGRRQRFFADVRLGDNEVVAHCANTGSMRSLLLPGTRALISPASNPARKLAWDLQLLRLAGTGTLACVNTQLPNRIVAEALAQGLIPGIPVGAQVKPEAVAGPGTRLDFRVEVPGQGACWIEVKNVTLVEPDRPGVAQFPDAVSERGLKHLRTLVALRSAGDRAVILYVVNRTDATSFAPAAHLDPAYARGLADALSSGVEALVCYTEILQIGGDWHVRVARLERHIP